MKTTVWQDMAIHHGGRQVVLPNPIPWDKYVDSLHAKVVASVVGLRRASVRRALGATDRPLKRWLAK